MISPGMNISTFHQWRKELVEHGSGAFPGSGDQSALEEEIVGSNGIWRERGRITSWFVFSHPPRSSLFC